MKTAVVILGHGSRSGGADQAIKRIAAEVKRTGHFEIVEHAFLQYVRPSFHETLGKCVRQGANSIVIVPFFMQPGAHVTKDIPALLEKARKQHPNLDIILTDFVGDHPLMTDIVLDLAGENK